MDNLPDANSALINYIDALLGEEEAPAQTVSSLEAKADSQHESQPVSVSEGQANPDPGPAIEPDIQMRQITEPELKQVPEGEAEIEQVAETQAKLVDEPESVKLSAHASSSDLNGMHLLFFKVAGIPLAIELDDVAEIIDTKDVVLLHDGEEADGVIGLFSHEGRDIQAIDTGAVILPEGHPARLNAKTKDSDFILLLSGYDLALSCDEKGEIIDLGRQDVEWRAQRQTRPWLAGMVKAHHRALVDADALIRDCGLESYVSH